MSAAAPSPFYRVSVKAVVRDAGGRLLVVQEPSGIWELPGGGWEHGETLLQCIEREMREELGAGVRRAALDRVRPVAIPSMDGTYRRLQLLVDVELDGEDLTPGDGVRGIAHVDEAALAALADFNGIVRAALLDHWTVSARPPEFSPDRARIGYIEAGQRRSR